MYLDCWLRISFLISWRTKSTTLSQRIVINSKSTHSTAGGARFSSVAITVALGRLKRSPQNLEGAYLPSLFQWKRQRFEAVQLFEKKKRPLKLLFRVWRSHMTAISARPGSRFRNSFWIVALVQVSLSKKVVTQEALQRSRDCPGIKDSRSLHAAERYKYG